VHIYGISVSQFSKDVDVTTLQDNKTPHTHCAKFSVYSSHFLQL